LNVDHIIKCMVQRVRAAVVRRERERERKMSETP